jgi:hypothetical protein
MQHADPYHAIFDILQTYDVVQQPVAVHMAIAKTKPRPALDFFDNLLALDALHCEADYRNAKILAC